MAVSVHSNFREQGEELIFINNFCEVYIPQDFMTRELISIIGDTVKLYGIFNFKVSDKEIKRSNNMSTNIFKFPSYIHMSPSDIEYGVNLQLKGDSQEEKYIVLKFNKGDRFINSLCIATDNDQVIDFVKIMSYGKLPHTIPYDKVLDLWLNNLSINNNDLGVTSVIQELFIAAIYRDKNDPSKAFRFVIDDKTSMYDYTTINLKHLANYNSAFTAVTFEDPDYALTNAITKTLYNQKEIESPIEKVIKY